MSDNHDSRDVGYWVYQIWKAIAGATGYLAVNLVRVGGTLVTLGQKAMAASFPVVLASDQSAVPTNVAEFGGVAIAQGQAAMAASVPVVVASDQTRLPVAEWSAWGHGETPAAGAPFVLNLPAGFEYIIDDVQVVLATDANVANRQVAITFSSAAFLATLQFGPDYDQPASLTRYYTFAPDVPMSAAPTAAGVFAGTLYIPVPQLQLAEGDQINIFANGLQAGDQFTIDILGRRRAL